MRLKGEGYGFTERGLNEKGLGDESSARMNVEAEM